MAERKTVSFNLGTGRAYGWLVGTNKATVHVEIGCEGKTTKGVKTITPTGKIIKRHIQKHVVEIGPIGSHKID